MPYSKNEKESEDEKIEKCMKDNLSFDDIAVVTVCLKADLKHCNKAEPVIKKIIKTCNEAKNQIKDNINWRWSGTWDDWEKELDEKTKMSSDFYKVVDTILPFTSIYNEKFEEIIEEYGFKKEIDKDGTLGWRAKHIKDYAFGDEYGMFPFYLDEETLRKRLKEMKDADEKEAEFQKEENEFWEND